MFPKNRLPPFPLIFWTFSSLKTEPRFPCRSRAWIFTCWIGLSMQCYVSTRRDIAMKSFVKINWSATDDNLDANSKVRLLNMCHDTSQIMMSDKDVAAISCQGMFSLSNHNTSLTRKSIKKQHAINNCITPHGTNFRFSLLSILHTMMAILIDSLLKDLNLVTTAHRHHIGNQRAHVHY